MRSLWPFVAGAIVAALVSLVTLPILAAVGAGMVAVGRLVHEEVGMAGTSSFSIRDEQGRYLTRQVNTSYTVVSVPMVGEPRPRRLLARLRVQLGEGGDGMASLDAWPMGAPSELRKPPLYSIHVPAAWAALGEDALFWTERGGRRTAYSLVDGGRLLDADLPVISFTFDPDARRLAAAAVAEEEFQAKGGVAVISYVAPGRVLRRAVLLADDPMRANTLRASIGATRLVSYTDESLGGRVIELPLASGPVRIPVNAADLDLARALLPPGLRLVPLVPWGRGGGGIY